MEKPQLRNSGIGGGERMDNWFKSKWFVRVVSLAFAILMYVFVNIEVTTSHNESSYTPSGLDEMQTINDVPVDIRIDSDRFVVSGVPEFVTVSLEGPNSILTPTVVQRNFDIFVDLENVGEGTHTVDIEHARVPSELSVYIEPKTIEVTIEERASKEFPVTVDFMNMDKLPDGYEIGEPEVNPGTVVITSAKSVIEQVSLVRAYIDVSGLTESIDNREIPVNVYDAQGNELQVRVEPENIVVSVYVDNPSKKVPLEISTKGEPPEDYELTSMTSDIDEVEVFANNEQLSEIDHLKTEDINLKDVKESGTVEAKISLPDGTSASKDKVNVKIELQQTKKFNEVPIELDDEDQDISFMKPDNPLMDITVTGEESKVNKLTKDDFRLSIQTNDLEVGEHQVPVQLEAPDGIEVKMEFEEVLIDIK